MNVLSLFSGVGGIDLGFERAGMRVVGQCEADRQARLVLQRHWPDVPCHPDVTELNAEWLEAHEISTAQKNDRGASRGSSPHVPVGPFTCEVCGAVWSEPPVDARSPETQNQAARPARSNTTTDRRGEIKGSGETKPGIAAVSVQGQANYAGANGGREAAGQGVREVFCPRCGHRPHRSGDEGRPNGNEQSPVSLQGMPHREITDGLEGGEPKGSHAIDIVCGGFP